MLTSEWDERPKTPTKRIKIPKIPVDGGIVVDRVDLEEKKSSSVHTPCCVAAGGGRRLNRFRRRTVLLLIIGLLTTILATALRQILWNSLRPVREFQFDSWVVQPTYHVIKNDRSYNDPEEAVLDVLIIGAGWAGLAAGDTLRRRGVENFEILEAHSAVGGRSRTVYAFPPKDLPVELGSAWTYANTVVHELAVQNQIPLGRIHYNQPRKFFGLYESRSLRGSSAATGEVSETDRKHFIKNEWWDGFVPFSRRQADRLKSQGQDKPYQEVLDEYIQKKHLPRDSKRRQFLKAMVYSNIKVDYAAPLSEISARAVGYSVNDCVFCGADYYVPVQGGGFDKILSVLADPLKDNVRMGAQVTKIEYDDEELVQVTYTDLSTGDSFKKLAKTAIVTVPLGVLKDDTIEFIPSLPEAKHQAIKYLKFGVLNKCIFYWNEAQASSWWPDGKEWLTLITDQDTKSGIWTTFFNEKEIGNGGHFVLSAWSGGDDAEAVELDSDETIVEQALSNLREMLGDSVPTPSKYVITRWSQEEFARGSYSFDPPGRPGQVEQAREALGDRVGSRLFWAGEATSVKYFGTTYGAFQTGERSAKDISSFLNNEKMASRGAQT